MDIQDAPMSFLCGERFKISGLVEYIVGGE